MKIVQERPGFVGPRNPSDMVAWAQGLTVTLLAWASEVGYRLNQSLAIDNATRTIGLTIDGSGAAITAGVKGYVTVPFRGRITGWSVIADKVGSIVIDVWSDKFGNFPPTIADTITGSEKPTLASKQIAKLEPVTDWDDQVTAGDVIAFNVKPTPSGVTRVTLTLTVQPS